MSQWAVRAISPILRVALITLVGLVLLWLMSLRSFYRDDVLLSGQFVAPQRLAVVAEAAERSPRDERPRLLAIASSETETFRIVPKGDHLPELKPLHGSKFDTTAYARAIPGRDVVIGQDDTAPGQAGPGRRWWMQKQAFETRVGLADGDHLVVTTYGPATVTFTGLPVGFGAGVMGTFVALLAMLVMLRETVPIRRLASAVGKLDPIQVEAPIPEPWASTPEIRSLVRAYNGMQSRISGLVRERAALIGGLSHDVRSFATRLQLRLNLINDPRERDLAEADIADMVRLLDDALLAIRSGVGELAEEMIDWTALVRDTVDVYGRGGAAVSCDQPVQSDAEGPFIIGDRLSLRRVLANLIDNALKYGGSARIATEIGPTRITCFVDDDGPGIPPSQRQVLLEAFTRLETSRNRNTGGAGLGLAIVKSIVEAHGGTVLIDDAPSGGARILFSLPRFHAEDP